MKIKSVILALGASLMLVAGSPWGPPSSGKCIINKQPDTADLEGVYYRDHVRAARLPSGLTYRYVHYRAHAGKPYILLLHGWPSSSFDWRRQFDFFHRRGYGIVAPDTLGFGGTDKPTDLDAYRFKNMARDLSQLLDCEAVGTVYGVGHDLGSLILSRVWSYYPERAAKYVFLDVGYAAPGQVLTKANIDAANAEGLKTVGYQPFAYWSFFNRTGAGAVFDAHRASAWNIMYPEDQQAIRETFCVPGALEAYLDANGTTPAASWLSAEDEVVHNRIFGPAHGGYEPSFNQYRSQYRDIDHAEEAGIPQDRANITKPVLLITAAHDPIVAPALSENNTRPYAPNLRTEQVDSGHFVMLQKADEVNQALTAFFESD